MPSGKKKIEKPRLSEEDKRKAEKAAYRKALVETGQHSVPAHKVHKNKKKYDRKKAKIDPEAE